MIIVTRKIVTVSFYEYDVWQYCSRPNKSPQRFPSKKKFQIWKKATDRRPIRDIVGEFAESALSRLGLLQINRRAIVPGSPQSQFASSIIPSKFPVCIKPSIFVIMPSCAAISLRLVATTVLSPVILVRLSMDGFPVRFRQVLCRFETKSFVYTPGGDFHPTHVSSVQLRRRFAPDTYACVTPGWMIGILYWNGPVQSNPRNPSDYKKETRRFRQKTVGRLEQRVGTQVESRYFPLFSAICGTTVCYFSHGSRYTRRRRSAPLIADGLCYNCFTFFFEILFVL